MDTEKETKTANVAKEEREKSRDTRLQRLTFVAHLQIRLKC